MSRRRYTGADVETLMSNFSHWKERQYWMAQALARIFHFSESFHFSSHSLAPLSQMRGNKIRGKQYDRMDLARYSMADLFVPIEPQELSRLSFSITQSDQKEQNLTSRSLRPQSCPSSSPSNPQLTVREPRACSNSS